MVERLSNESVTPSVAALVTVSVQFEAADEPPPAESSVSTISLMVLPDSVLQTIFDDYADFRDLAAFSVQGNLNTIGAAIRPVQRTRPEPRPRHPIPDALVHPLVLPRHRGRNLVERVRKVRGGDPQPPASSSVGGAVGAAAPPAAPGRTAAASPGR